MTRLDPDAESLTSSQAKLAQAIKSHISVDKGIGYGTEPHVWYLGIHLPHRRLLGELSPRRLGQCSL